MMWEAPTEDKRNEAESDLHCAGWKAAVQSRDARIATLEAELAAERGKADKWEGIVQLWEAYLIEGDDGVEVSIMLAFGKAADATKAARGVK